MVVKRNQKSVETLNCYYEGFVYMKATEKDLDACLIWTFNALLTVDNCFIIKNC